MGASSDIFLYNAKNITRYFSCLHLFSWYVCETMIYCLQMDFLDTTIFIFSTILWEVEDDKKKRNKISL